MLGNTQILRGYIKNQKKIQSRKSNFNITIRKIGKCQVTFSVNLVAFSVKMSLVARKSNRKRVESA